MLSRAEKRRNQRQYGDEMVFCIPANETVTLDKELWTYPDGKIPKNLWGMFDEKGNYVKRADVEGTTDLYQIIPYICIINEKQELLAHIHKKTGKISLGFSGHIGPDNGHKDVLSKACMEIIIKEQLAVGGNMNTPASSFKGFIKTFTEETKGHIGVFFSKGIPSSQQLPDEDGHFEYKFMTIDDLMDSYGNLEKWAKLVLNFYYEAKIKEGK